MNYKRVLVGGVAAGLIFNVGGMASALLMNLPAAFARLGVEPSASAGLLHLGLRFGLGLASVLIYVGVRPRWGAGPATAIKTGLLVWFIGYVPGSAVLHELGVLTNNQFAFALCWGVAEAVAATMVAGWLYREDAEGT